MREAFKLVEEQKIAEEVKDRLFVKFSDHRDLRQHYLDEMIKGLQPS